ncbi:MAG: hypothetical protein JO141_17185 [Bradyrhizobium sp.]|nr:hypothetical protein [Bradyrhizobium sp.]
MDVGTWLAGLDQYGPLFREHAIEADILPELTDQPLSDLGVPLGGSTETGARHLSFEVLVRLSLGLLDSAAGSDRPCATLAGHVNSRRDLRVDRAGAGRDRGRRNRCRRAQCQGIAGAALVKGAFAFICVNDRVVMRFPPEIAKFRHESRFGRRRFRRPQAFLSRRW